MKIDAYASMSHYAAHIAPIWQALPEEARGRFMAPRDDCWWGPSYRDRTASPDPLIVSSFADAQAMPHRDLIYVEHGAGQHYPGDPHAAGHGSYAGGNGLTRALLFLCPSDTVAARWRAAYAAPAVVVGSPFLDRWHENGPESRPRTDPLTVAVSFHWDCRLIPETRSAWPHYNEVLPALVADPRWHLLGHGHPRLWGKIERRWRALNVEHTPVWPEVLDRADLLIADNTSALYEFASTGRPVLVLNAPFYRRAVHHGLRFWDYVPGLQVDEPHQLADAIPRALADPPIARQLRRRAVEHVYDRCDGHAAERAAAAILEVLT